MKILSEDCLNELFFEKTISKIFVQILAIKKVTLNDVTFFRLCISDGVNYYNRTIVDSDQNSIIINENITVNQVVCAENVKIIEKMDEFNKLIKIILIKKISKKEQNHKINEVIGVPQNLLENMEQEEKEFPIMKISELYLMPNTFGIEGTVIEKEPLRKWKNNNGEGTVFSFRLRDDSDSIKFTAFREQAEIWSKKIEIDETYRITKCKIRMANRQYSTDKYEILILKNTEILKI